MIKNIMVAVLLAIGLVGTYIVTTNKTKVAAVSEVVKPTCGCGSQCNCGCKQGAACGCGK